MYWNVLEIFCLQEFMFLFLNVSLGIFCVQRRLQFFFVSIFVAAAVAVEESVVAVVVAGIAVAVAVVVIVVYFNGGYIILL